MEPVYVEQEWLTRQFLYLLQWSKRTAERDNMTLHSVVLSRRVGNMLGIVDEALIDGVRIFLEQNHPHNKMLTRTEPYEGGKLISIMLDISHIVTPTAEYAYLEKGE
jgi:hypothetical protein